VASLADQRLRATAAQLSDALSAGTTLHPVYRRLLKLTLEELRLIEEHLGQLDQQILVLHKSIWTDGVDTFTTLALKFSGAGRAWNRALPLATAVVVASGGSW
jgi:hypothetical protein